LERTRKHGFVDKSSCNLEDMKKTRVNLSQYMWSPDRYLKLTPSKYEITQLNLDQTVKLNLKNPPHRDSNPRPSGWCHSASNNYATACPLLRGNAGSKVNIRPVFNQMRLGLRKQGVTRHLRLYLERYWH
jgi:hypothetical protein